MPNARRGRYRRRETIVFSSRGTRSQCAPTGISTRSSLRQNRGEYAHQVYADQYCPWPFFENNDARAYYKHRHAAVHRRWEACRWTTRRNTLRRKKGRAGRSQPARGQRLVENNEDGAETTATIVGVPKVAAYNRPRAKLPLALAPTTSDVDRGRATWVERSRIHRGCVLASAKWWSPPNWGSTRRLLDATRPEDSRADRVTPKRESPERGSRGFPRWTRRSGGIVAPAESKVACGR